MMKEHSKKNQKEFAERLQNAQKDFEAMKKELAPYMDKDRFHTVSTQGKWESDRLAVASKS